MPTCFLCNTSVATIRALFAHFKLSHHSYVFTSYSCTEKPCCRRFSSLNSFRHHLIAKHPDTECSRATDVGKEAGSNEAVNTAESAGHMASAEAETEAGVPSPDDVPGHVLDDQDSLSPEAFRERIFSESLRFISKLYSKPSIPRNHVQSITDDITDLLSNGFIPVIREAIEKVFKEHALDVTALREIESMFDSLENPFQNLSSEHLRFSALAKSTKFVSPKMYYIGSRNEVVNGKLKPVDVNGTHIPLSETLKTFLEIPNALNDIQDYMSSLRQTDNDLSNFIQGSIWAEKTSHFSDSDVVLPLWVYYDGFQSNPALSPHPVKIGATYVSIPCLPPSCQSSTVNIFLSLLFEEDDRREFGNRRAFAPLVEDLKLLAERGVLVDTGNGQVRVFFVLCLLVADNLGLHCLCGLVEGFTANYPCRLCKAPKREVQFMCKELEAMMRSLQTYEEDLALNDASKTGVKEFCVFNEAPFYHVSDNFYADVMHDLMEGVCHYVMLLILRHFVQDKTFTLADLNNKLATFDYGKVEKNKPSLLREDALAPDKTKLKMTASEMLCFIRMFGVLMGDRVLENDPFWNLYLLLRKIVDIATSKSVCREDGVVLKSLVEEHNSLFLKLSKSTLKPKFHHLIHYNTVMLCSGPLSLQSCFRFEAKHQQLKAYANVNKSRINVVFSLATKNQLQFCHSVFARKSIIPEMNVGPEDVADLSDVKYFPQFVGLLPRPVQLNPGDLFVTKWVDFKGTKYQSGMALLVDASDEIGPIFGVIHAILIFNNEPLFVCFSTVTERHNEHVAAFQVKVNHTDFIVVSPVGLLEYQPLSVVKFQGDSYVVPRSNLL